MLLRYEVYDLGAHEVIATFRTKQDADDWALAKSVNGPALQVLSPRVTDTALEQHADMRGVE